MKESGCNFMRYLNENQFLWYKISVGTVILCKYVFFVLCVNYYQYKLRLEGGI